MIKYTTKIDNTCTASIPLDHTDDDLSLSSWDYDETSSTMLELDDSNLPFPVVCSIADHFASLDSPPSEDRISQRVVSATPVSESSNIATQAQEHFSCAENANGLWTVRELVTKNADKVPLCPILMHESTLRLTKKMKLSARTRALVGTVIPKALRTQSTRWSSGKEHSPLKVSKRNFPSKASNICSKYKSFDRLQTPRSNTRRLENSICTFLRSNRRYCNNATKI